MKRLALVFLMMSATLLYAADIIITRSSTKINAIIEEVGATSIKYHKADNPNGPLVVLETNQIATIIYGNGEVQTFEEVPVVEQSATPTQQTMAPYSQMNYPSAYPQNNAMMGANPFVDYRAIEQHRKDSIKTAKKAAYKAKLDSMPREQFLIFNYAYAFSNMHSVGLTYGWCHAAGFYANAMLGVSGFHYKTAGTVGFESDWSGYYYDAQLTNKHTKQRISISAGLLVRLKGHLFLNVGLGYSYYTRTYEATNGDWVRLEDPKPSGVAYQIGLIGNIKGCTLMANYSAFANWRPEISIGIGFAIPNKKGGNK